MKHLLICLLAGFLLFSYIEVSYRPAEEVRQESSSGRETAEAQQSLRIGLLLGKAEDTGSVAFRMAFEKGFGAAAGVHVVDSCGSAEIQESMFDRMVQSGCQAIVVELLEESDARYFQSRAAQMGIPLLMTGERPDTVGEGAVYLGSETWNLARAIAEETWDFWQESQSVLDHREPKGTLTYSAVTENGFEAEGGKAVFEQYLSEQGLPVSMSVDSVVRTPGYDLHHEVDNTLYGKSELLICETSNDAKRIVDYFNDPTEFQKRPRALLAVMTVDETVRELLERGEVAFACGTSSAELGSKAAEIVGMMLKGEDLRSGLADVETQDGKYCFYLGEKLRAKRES